MHGPGFEPKTSVNTGAMLYQLSYEAIHSEPGHFVGSHEGISSKFMVVNFIKLSLILTKFKVHMK